MLWEDLGMGEFWLLLALEVNRALPTYLLKEKLESHSQPKTENELPAAPICDLETANI